MNARLLTLFAVLAAFGVLTALALMEVGFFGIIRPHFQSWGGAQVFFDLVIMGVLVIIWIVRDAPQRGLPAWPFVIATLALGSFGPLAYLVVREFRAGAAR